MAIPTLAANCTWFTQGGTSVKRASITKITIVDSYTPTGSEKSSWDASAAKDGGVMAYVTGTELIIAGNGSGKIYLNADSSDLFSDSKKVDYFKNVTVISGGEMLDTYTSTSLYRAFNYCQSLIVCPSLPNRITNFRATFQNCYALTTVNCSNWDTSLLTTTANMFNKCYALLFADVGNWDVSNVTEMTAMFQNCYALTSIGETENWSTGKVASMRNMFLNCRSLVSVNVTNWDTRSLVDTYAMFSSDNDDEPMTIKTVIGIGTWDVSHVTDMSAMFQNCKYLERLDLEWWHPVSCTSMRKMFRNCNALETIGNTEYWEIPSCEDLSYLFGYCSSLSSLNSTKWGVGAAKTMMGMFDGCSSVTGLDVSNWDTSACTDMSFMFYGCTKQKTLDTSKWDVSRVTTFDHMFAHAGIDIGDISNWEPSTACVNMNAMFWGISSTTLDVSKFNTSNVQFFCQMFEGATNLVDIIGLENFDTSNGLGFDEMFDECHSLKRLNLSSFDTRKAKDGVEASANGHTTKSMYNMFYNCRSLERVELGPNFSMKGMTTNASNYAVLPTPNATYIPGADGSWYDIEKTAFDPANMPDGTGTYFASADVAEAEDNKLVLVKQGTLLRTANAIREKNGGSERYSPSAFPDAIRGIGT